MAGPLTIAVRTIDNGLGITDSNGNVKYLGIAALIGGAINGSLSFLTGDGVSFKSRGPSNDSWAIQPTIPVPQFAASYSAPSLGTVAYSAAIGAALGTALTWFMVQASKAEQDDFDKKLRQFIKNKKR